MPFTSEPVWMLCTFTPRSRSPVFFIVFPFLFRGLFGLSHWLRRRNINKPAHGKETTTTGNWLLLHRDVSKRRNERFLSSVFNQISEAVRFYRVLYVFTSLAWLSFLINKQQILKSMERGKKVPNYCLHREGTPPRTIYFEKRREKLSSFLFSFLFFLWSKIIKISYFVVILPPPTSIFFRGGHPKNVTWCVEDRKRMKNARTRKSRTATLYIWLRLSV